MATTSDDQTTHATRELAAIMFSDIVSYTAIMGRDEQEGLEARKAHRELLMTLLPRFNGRLLGDLGDGALSSFHSAIEAVNCARAFQGATGSDSKFKIRIGIHIGDVLFADNTVLGDGVNVASRLVALAAPGGICISEKVFDEIRNQRGITGRNLGPQRLKNVDRPVIAYALTDGIQSTAVKTVAIPTRTIAIGATTVILLALVVAGVRFYPKPHTAPAEVASQPEAKPHPIRSIAVLPLDNYSGDPKEEYFADGMTDELTTDLAKISALRVVSRGSAMRFKGANRPSTPEIGKLLNVDAVVEGSVLRSGRKVRITAQLIDAPADKHIWADSFERDVADVLALQDELASAIAKEIEVQVTPSEQARLKSARSVNPQAYDMYLQGRFFFDRPSDEDLKKALAKYEEAIKLDPSFAPVYAGIADAYNWIGWNDGFMTAAEAMVKNKAAAERAVQLDDDSADAHAALGCYKYSFEFDWPVAEKELLRAIELNPNYGYAHDQYGYELAQLGRFDEAIAQGERAIELAPLSSETLWDSMWALVWSGNFERARANINRALEIDPESAFGRFSLGWSYLQEGKPHEAIAPLKSAFESGGLPFTTAYLGYAYGASGDRADALAIIEALTKRSINGYVPLYSLAVVYMGLGDGQRAIEFLERANDAHEQQQGLLKNEKIFDPLRKEPRFIALMKKLNFE